jgi:FAD/FMN-containing dehydrogenase
MNGMSVPRPGETLFDLTGVRHVVWRGKGTITAGAGLSVWELDQYVRRFGWKLPVVNDGSAEAPSVGGFIAAGGIGADTVFYGGFWESVSSVTIVTGTGDVRRIGAEDALFPWLFGSMGTLGIVYEAALELVPSGATQPVTVADVASLPRSPAASWPEHLWLTLFVGESHHENAVARLAAIVESHPGAWQPRGSYEYYLLHRRFNPPFLFEDGADFIALGIWGDRSAQDPELCGYFALEAAFQELVEQQGFRRYFQSELIRQKRDLSRYVGSDCAERYGAIKAGADPSGLLNAF